MRKLLVFVVFILALSACTTTGQQSDEGLTTPTSAVAASAELATDPGTPSVTQEAPEATADSSPATVATEAPAAVTERAAADPPADTPANEPVLAIPLAAPTTLYITTVDNGQSNFTIMVPNDGLEYSPAQLFTSFSDPVSQNGKYKWAITDVLGTQPSGGWTSVAGEPTDLQTSNHTFNIVLAAGEHTKVWEIWVESKTAGTAGYDSVQVTITRMSS